METRLREQAQVFADDLTDLIKTINPTSSPFSATLAPARADGKYRCAVQQTGTNGIPLLVKNEVLIVVTATYTCTLDHEKEFLAVHSSSFKVYAKKAEGEPLFRWDYLREPGESGIPSAHMHVQAHRDAATYVMVKSGKASRRATSRAKDGVPKLSQLHFPLGGARFRPCLEDLIEGLINEFGLEHDQSVLDRLADGRERWRVMQLQAAVRDAPESAVQSLVRLGYSVTPPSGPIENHRERLRRF